MKRPVMLIVLDGWGYREETKDNAIAAAHTPNFASLWQRYPHCLLKASGDAVGLPEGQMGNSEVGHMTIGAGTPIDTDLVRIDKEIASGSFGRNPTITALFDHAKKNGSVLHAMGLVSTGGVHSHQDHLFAFLRLAKEEGVKSVAVHAFTDGRDTPPQSAAEYLKELEAVLDELGPGFFIATVSGRYYAMDRDKNWDRLARVEAAIFEGKGTMATGKPSSYLESRYAEGEKDELLEPLVFPTPFGSGCPLKKGDAAFFFNFRADRARMLSTKMLALPKDMDVMFATMTEYSADFGCPVAYPPLLPKTTLGEQISRAGIQQDRIAETEKFAHATYFLNGGNEAPYPGERDIMLPSRKDVKTHDEAPEMRAEGIADKAIEEIEKGEAGFIFINFANADMVGHTANVPAIIKSVETVDAQLARVIGALEEKGGVAIITADHGNAEINIDPVTGAKHTAHTTSPVPCIVTLAGASIHDGGLADVSPTILSLLELPLSPDMTGKPLITS